MCSVIFGIQFLLKFDRKKNWINVDCPFIKLLCKELLLSLNKKKLNYIKTIYLIVDIKVNRNYCPELCNRMLSYETGIRWVSESVQVILYRINRIVFLYITLFLSYHIFKKQSEITWSLHWYHHSINTTVQYLYCIVVQPRGNQAHID